MVIDTKLSEGPWQAGEIGWPEPLEVQQRQMLSPEYGEEYLRMLVQAWDWLSGKQFDKERLEGADNKVITSQQCIPRPTTF